MPILQLIFPKYCLGCGIQGKYLCDVCASVRVQYLQQHKCHVCKSNMKGEKLVHLSCSQKSYLDGVIVIARYSDLMKRLVRELKYQYITQIVAELGFVVRASPAWKRVESLEVDCVFAVPLHKNRQRERGFNQAELIANELGYSRESGLIRKIATKAQAKLKRKERLKNLAGAFTYNGDELSHKKVLLVDDVMTTGATLEACAKVLLEAGADKVYAVVLARG